MAKVSVGRLMARALKKEGIDTVFTLVGGHIMPILYGCRDEGIRVIDVRHECAGGYAAIAYAKVTGKPGVLVTTAGPGITNAETAMAEAWETGVPLIHIGGGSPLKQNEMGPMQNVDSLGSMSVFSKWARKIYQGARAQEYVSMAFRNALAGNPGPVYLEVAIDTVNEMYEEAEVFWPENYRPFKAAAGAPDLIEQAAEALASAKKPVIAIGQAAPYSAEDPGTVKALVEYLQAPTYVQMESRGLFGDELKDKLFTIGEGALGKADVVLELGVDRNYKFGMGKPPRIDARAKRIVVHTDGAKIGWNWNADIAIVGGITTVAGQLLEAISKKRSAAKAGDWIAEAEEATNKARAPYIEAMTDDRVPCNPGRVAAEAAKFVRTEGKDWHIVCDGGDSACWIDALATASYRGQVLRYGPLGTIGTGQGQTIGAWAADGKPVLYFTGDGSFGFYMGEWDTYVRHNIPVVCVICNDSSWGMIRLSEEMKGGIEEKGGQLGTMLAPMRAYEKLPEMWGGVGLRVTRPEELIPAIRKVYESGLPGIVNIEADQSIASPPTAAFSGAKKK